MEIEASCTFDASASKVWALLEDFAAIQQWWPDDGPITVARVECEGSGIGMIRHIYNLGMNVPVSERLDYLDAGNKTLILSIVGERPKGIDAYVAICKLVDISADQCRLDYRGFVSVSPGTDTRTEANIRFTWDRMFEGLRRHSCQGPLKLPDL